MIFEMVSSLIILNLLFEILEIIFPSKFLNDFIKSIISIIFLYEIVKIIVDSINIF